MTMIPAAHPDPERLAALAGEDADALVDRELTTHVKGCVACDTQVRELASLQATLAQLPDLTPSRPLQYVPPVPAQPDSRWRIAFRRAFAPVAVIGLAFVLVGGLGATGQIGTDPAGVLQNLVPFQRSAAEQPAAAPEVDAGGTGPTDTDGQGELAPGASQGFDTESTGTGPQTEREDFQAIASQALSWVYVVATGLGLLVLAFVMWVVGAPRRLPVRRR